MERKHRTLIGLGSAALLALALATACISDPDPETEGTLQGVLRDDCGPTDGPSLYISMDKSKALTCADFSPGEFKVMVDWARLDSLKKGTVLRDSMAICKATGCEPTLFYKIDVEGVDSAKVQGTVEVTEIKGGLKTGRRFKAELKKCPRPTYMCG